MAEPERHAEVRRKTGNKGPNTKFQTSDKRGTEKIKISFFNDKAAGRGKGKGQGKGRERLVIGPSVRIQLIYMRELSHVSHLSRPPLFQRRRLVVQATCPSPVHGTHTRGINLEA